jgi:hypothetical protein
VLSFTLSVTPRHLDNMDHDLLERIRRLPRRAEYMLPEQPLHNDDPELDSGAESDQETNRDRPFPRGIDPVSSQLPFPHRNARLTSGAVHARSNRQMEEQDRDDLELENQRTWEELDRVRRWKNRLRQENKSLREETESLRREVKELRKRDEDSRAEIKRLKGRYEDVWHDKVVLAEQLSVSTGSASLLICYLIPCRVPQRFPSKYCSTSLDSLPEEIFTQPFSTLASLRSGSGKSSSLSFTRRWYSMAVELWHLNREPVSISMHTSIQSRLQQYDTCQCEPDKILNRFVYAGAYISSTLVERYFPNVRAILSLLPVRNRDWDQTPDETEGYTSFRTQLSLVHPVRANTLGSLMAHSVKWVMGRSTRYHPIRGVSSVMFEKDGAILASGSEVVERPFRNLVRTCIIGASSAVEAESLGQSIRQLAMFVPVMPKYAEGSRRDNDIHYPTLKIHANTVAALDAWLAGVSLSSLVLGIVRSDLFLFQVVDFSSSPTWSLRRDLCERAPHSSRFPTTATHRRCYIHRRLAADQTRNEGPFRSMWCYILYGHS